MENLKPGVEPELGTLAPRPAWKSRVLWLLVLLVPLLLAGSMVMRNAVNVPVWDDWERGPLLAKAEAGELTFGDLYAAHIQHRMLYPRALIVAFNYLSNGDLRWEMAASFLTICLTAALAVWLVARTVGRDAWGTGLLVAALVFHSLQFQNMLWGIQIAFVTPVLGLLASVALWHSRLAVHWRFIGCLVFVYIGNHSFSHGILLWPCMLVMILCDPRISLRARMAWGAAWCVMGAVVLGLYFHNLENVSHPVHSYHGKSESAQSSPLSVLLNEPGKFLAFFFTLLGSLWARVLPGDAVDIALGFGILHVALFTFAGMICLFWWKDPAKRVRMLPWLVIGLFAILSAAAVATGRAGVIGTSRGLSPRYLGMTLYLPLACIALGALLVRLREEEKGECRLLDRFWATFGGMVAILMVITWVQGERLAADFSHARLQGRARLALLPFIREGQAIVSLDGDYSFYRTQARFLDSKGWIKPSILKEPWLDAFPQTKALKAGDRVGIDRVLRNETGYRIEGRASLPKPYRPADAVVLCQEKEGRLRIVAVADPNLSKASLLLRPDYEFSNRRSWPKMQPDYWVCQIPAHLWPKEGEPALTAWVLDAREWKIRKILQEIPKAEAPDGIIVDPADRNT